LLGGLLSFPQTRALIISANFDKSVSAFAEYAGFFGGQNDNQKAQEVSGALPGFAFAA
jgi:hypothetical protein